MSNGGRCRWLCRWRIEVLVVEGVGEWKRVRVIGSGKGDG